MRDGRGLISPNEFDSCSCAAFTHLSESDALGFTLACNTSRVTEGRRNKGFSLSFLVSHPRATRHDGRCSPSRWEGRGCTGAAVPVGGLPRGTDCPPEYFHGVVMFLG